MVSFTSLILLVAAGVAGVSGHASLQPPVAIPNRSTQIGIRIPHGCNKTSTTRVTVKIPEGVTSVKPEMLAGWQIQLAERDLNPPIDSHGTLINKTLDTVTWFGGYLPDAYYLDFNIQCKLPNATDGDTLAFETVQSCENGEVTNWNGPAAPKLTFFRNNTLLKVEDFPLLSSNLRTAAQDNSAAHWGASSMVSAGAMAAVAALGFM
ncbi:hypothetical protein HDU85_002846 [Gaertneriomyces sp. JEL0708]|nr:hypothetical protein HDU85_002846 [Gaertneriomyces sp. JEL0708]